MLQLLLRWIFSAIALYGTVYAAAALHLPGFFIASGLPGVQGALIFVVVLAIANAVLRPLLQMFTLPLTCLTLGLFSFVINAFLFWLVGQFMPGFHVAGWKAPLFGTVVMSIIGGLLNNLLISRREREQKN